MAKTPKTPPSETLPADVPSKPAAPAARERGGWLAKIAPGVRNLAHRTQRDTPDNLWVKAGVSLMRP